MEYEGSTLGQEKKALNKVSKTHWTLANPLYFFIYRRSHDMKSLVPLSWQSRRAWDAATWVVQLNAASRRAAVEDRAAVVGAAELYAAARRATAD